MLLVSRSNLTGNIKYLFPDIVMLNLSSFNETYPRVGLMPPPDLNCLDDDNFDIEFFKYIFNNDYVFLELMKIIMPLYFGNDVCLLTTQHDVLDKITESLLKIIQSRYGYNSSIVNDKDDILDIYSSYSTEDYSFSLEGLAMLDVDKERYSYLVTYINSQNGVNINV